MEMTMSKQQTNTKPAPTPAELIASAESDIARLEQEREVHVARGVELAERRKSASYAAHVRHEGDARQVLDAVNAEMATHASELASYDDALVTARGKLADAQRLAAVATEKAHIAEQRQLNDEYKKLGKWLDRAADDLVAGMRGARSNANKLGHPGTTERVLGALIRCLKVKVRGTPLQMEFGVADSNDQRSKLYCADDDAGRALRAAHQMSKGVTIVHFGEGTGTCAMDAEGLAVQYPPRRFADGSSSPDDFNSAEGVSDEPEEDLAAESEDAMAALDAKAVELRKRDPSLSHAQAFSKAYCDPANVHLVRRERMASRAKLYR
jgi:hypothetical protein